MKTALILNAAGKGTRTQLDIPKQFFLINGISILEYTLLKFLETNIFDLIVIVTLPNYIKNLQFIRKKNIEIIEGDTSCIKSRVRGLNYVAQTHPDIEKVMFHDAVRPFLTTNLISTCIQKCNQENPCVLPYILTVSTLKNGHHLDSKEIFRDPIAILQTPETFMLQNIYNIVSNLQEDLDNYWTLPNLYEHYQGKCLYIEGELQNFKITNSSDLELAKNILNGRFNY